MRFFFAFLLSIIASLNIIAQESEIKSQDRIYSLRKLAKDKSIAIEDRIKYAREAIELSKLTKKDSAILSSNRVLSYLFLVNQDIDSLYNINMDNLKLSIKLKDTLKMGYASQNIAYYFEEKNKPDSSYQYYFKARKFYNTVGDKRNEAGVLLNMANIQETERDFIGCEINSINGIEILKELEPNDDIYDLLWSFNNLIGIVSGQIERYDKAIEYHSKALDYSSKIKGDYILNLYSRTNIAILYRRKGDYKEANVRLTEILKDKTIKEQDPSTYSSLLSASAYCYLLNHDKNYDKMESLFRESLKVAEQAGNIYETMSASEFFSEYFLERGVKDSAIFYADKAYTIAQNLNANKTILNTLVLKAKINEGEKSKDYLFEHITLSDSLILKERAIRNKFARIDYETDIIKQEKDQISKQRLWLFFISIGLLVTLLFLYIIKTQREKNKELLFAQQQQKANEEIYNLMLTQQDKMDEARALEKKRISEELHDGILGRLFGARLSLDSLNLSKTDDAVKNRSNYINEIKEIEQDIRKVSHDLNTDFIANSSFLDIIKTLVGTQSLAYKLKYSINSDSDINWEIMSNKSKIHMYRIIQESLQNIYKHAHATKVEIRFQQKNNLISLSIQDDGDGFDVNKTRKGIGLKNIQSRVNEIKGKMYIDTKKHIGTNIKIEVPNNANF